MVKNYFSHNSAKRDQSESHGEQISEIFLQGIHHRYLYKQYGYMHIMQSTTLNQLFYTVCSHIFHLDTIGLKLMSHVE